MDEREQDLFRQFEKDTRHRFLLKLTERLAKFSWLLMAIAIALLIGKRNDVGYAVMVISLSMLFISLFLGILAERVRKRIQDRVDRELGS